MLINLYVKNLALIDEIECNFKEGLNIITGETGAGKSIIIGSVNLALGAKADKELIRQGAEYALIELTFQTEDKEIFSLLEEMDIPTEDGNIVISRRIMPTRSVSKINGETVTVKQVKMLAEMLIDIHGQHEHQSLLNRKKHGEILDFFAGEELYTLKEIMSEEYKNYKDCKRRLEEESVDEQVRRRELELARYEAAEIERANPIIGEDETLEQEYRRMLNGRKITGVLMTNSQLMGYDTDSGAANQIGRALRELKSVTAYDDKLADLEEMLVQIEQLTSDYCHGVSGYLDEFEYNEEEFFRIEERLNVLNHLKGKYGNSLEQVLSYAKDTAEKIAKYEDYDAYLQNLNEEKDALWEKLKNTAEKVSKIRKEKAVVLEKYLIDTLQEMNFMEVQFQVRISETDTISENGMDETEFFISTNPGEVPRPLSQVASGGELSRIMLAIKTVFADKDAIETLIFDEIDTGISGKTAWKIAEKIGQLGKNHQIMCITHLPQIAAMADHHFVIEKLVGEQGTITSMRELSEENSVLEMARLLGGEEITEAVLTNAKEMRQMAKIEKSNIMK